ncbi:hypothetical protein HDU67_005751, partial [Dinochytrium kinnereticum]
WMFPLIHDQQGLDPTAMTYRDVQARFKEALVASGVYAHDSLQGLRVAGAISAALPLPDLTRVMAQGAWRSGRTAARYSQLSLVLHSGTHLDLALLRQWRDQASDFLFLVNPEAEVFRPR